MMKILVFPLFQFPTGHLKVAETVNEYIAEKYPEAELKIIDFLSYCNCNLEKMISSIYFKWINTTPSIYRTLYKTVMYSDQQRKLKPDFRFFSLYFEKKMKKLIEDEDPSLIICTHSFPSSVIGKLKNKGSIHNISTVNIYTDFFMNDIWAKKEIQYHFVPHVKAKEKLISDYQIKEESIFVTGIPVKSSFDDSEQPLKTTVKHVLVAGGNNGLYKTNELIQMMNSLSSIKFTVLCGNNRELYSILKQLDSSHIQPRGYIHCSKELDRLYSEVDAILTKPGGVTISEAIRKRIPIFILNSLPGQEEINLNFLLKEGIAISILPYKLIEQVTSILTNEEEMTSLKKKMDLYLEKLSCPFSEAISSIISKEFSYKLIKSQ